MGAFNKVKAELPCPYCGLRQEWNVQFKYGNCWQFEYHLGDKIRWGGNEIGEKVAGNVRAPGIAEEFCKGCSRDFINAVVYFTDNIIQKVELLRESIPEI